MYNIYLSDGLKHLVKAIFCHVAFAAKLIINN